MAPRDRVLWFTAPLTSGVFMDRTGDSEKAEFLDSGIKEVKRLGILKMFDGWQHNILAIPLACCATMLQKLNKT